MKSKEIWKIVLTAVKYIITLILGAIGGQVLQ